MKEYISHVRKRLREGLLFEVLNEMKWIGRYSIRYKGAVMLYILLGIFSTAMGLGTGVVSKYIIDAVTGYDSSALFPAAAGYVAMMLLQVGVSAWSGRVTAKNRIMVNQEIRAEVFGKVLGADWEKLSEYHSGDLLNRLNSDVNTVATSVLGWIPTFITGVVQFFSTLALILYYDPMMALLALASAPVTLAMSRVLMRKMRFHNKKMLEVNSDMMAFNEEAFQNLQYIKAFGLMDKYSGLFHGKQDYYRDVQLDYNKFSIMTSLPYVHRGHGGHRGMFRLGRLPPLDRCHHIRNHDAFPAAGGESLSGVFQSGKHGAYRGGGSYVGGEDHGGHGPAGGGAGGCGGSGGVQGVCAHRRGRYDPCRES